MVSKVIISPHAQQQLENYVLYVLLEKENAQAAKSITEDALITKTGFLILQTISGILMTKTLLTLATGKFSSNMLLSFSASSSPVHRPQALSA